MTTSETTWIGGGIVVTASERVVADAYVTEGRIVAIGLGLDLSVDQTVDASGCIILRRGVDPHVHIVFPMLTTTTADDPASGTAAAA